MEDEKRMKYRKGELTRACILYMEVIKAQKIKWFGHILKKGRRSEDG